MDEDDVIEKLKSIDLANWRHQLVTVPAYIIIIIFVAGWVGRDNIASATGFVKQEELAQLEQKVETHLLEYRMDFAMRQIRAAEDELALHRKTPVQDDQLWTAEERALLRKLELARDFKACVLESMHVQRGNGPSCSMIQRQLWQ